MSSVEEHNLKVQAEALKKHDFSGSKWHKQDAKQTLAELKTDVVKGLTTAQAEQAQKTYGKNELDKEEEKSLWERIIEQFEDLLVRILLLAATISFVIAITGDGEEGLQAYVEPFVILLILVLNAIVAIWQDSNADNALEALKDMQAQTCRVCRNGEW